MPGLTLKSKKELKDIEYDIFELLDQGVKVFFIPIGHKCDRELNLEQIMCGLIPDIQVIFIHRRLEHEVYCLLQAYKLHPAASEVEGHNNSDPDSEDNLSTAAGHMKCPSCFKETTF